MTLDMAHLIPDIGWLLLENKDLIVCPPYFSTLYTTVHNTSSTMDIFELNKRVHTPASIVKQGFTKRLYSDSHS